MYATAEVRALTWVSLFIRARPGMRRAGQKEHVAVTTLKLSSGVERSDKIIVAERR